MTTLAEQADLLKALFDAAGEPGSSLLWRQFLQQLAKTTRAQGASLVVSRESGSAVVWELGVAALSRPIHSAMMRHERVYSQADLPEPFAGAAPLRAIRCRVGPAGHACLAIHRTGQDFRAADAALMGRFVPFLGQALAIWQRLQIDHASAALDRRICDRLQTASIVFATSGVVRHISGTAAAMLAQSAQARILGNNRIEFADTNTAQEFRQGFAKCIKDSAVVDIQIGSTPSLYLSLERDIWCGEPTVTGILRGALRAQTLAAPAAAKILRISLSQARLAILLCDGHSLASAAALLGWTIETARSCSKQIFARTGTNGQTDLVRKMLDSSMWLHRETQARAP